MSKILQTITPNQKEHNDFVLNIINTETLIKREYGRYADKTDLDQAVEELKSNASLSENEEIKTEYTGSEVVIEKLSISRRTGTGDLIMTADFQVINKDAEVTFNGSSDEYINSYSGQINTALRGLMRRESQLGLFDVITVQDAINDFLIENPIDKTILKVARHHEKLEEDFNYSDHITDFDNDNSRVIYLHIYPSEGQVNLSFSVVFKEQEDGNDFPTYSKSDPQYAKYDSETGAFQFADDFDKQNSLNPAAIKGQLDEYLETTEAQAEIQRVTNVIIESKRVDEIAENLEEGEAVVASCDVIVEGFTLTTDTSFAVKEDGIAVRIISFSEVDLETGKSAYTDNIDDYYVSPELHEKLNSLLNEYLEANPISEDLLNYHREDAENQKTLATEFDALQTDKRCNVAITQMQICINSENEVVAIVDIIDREDVEEGAQEYRYVEHHSLSETLDIDKKSVVHRSQTSLCYNSYDIDHVRFAVSQHIKDHNVMTDEFVAEIRSHLADKSEENDSDRMRHVA